MPYAEREAAGAPPPEAPGADATEPKKSSMRASRSSTVATARPGAVRLRTASLIAPSSVNTEDKSSTVRSPARLAARQRRPRWLAAAPGGETGLRTAKMLARRPRSGALHAREATRICFWSSVPKRRRCWSRTVCSRASAPRPTMARKARWNGGAVASSQETREAGVASEPPGCARASPTLAARECASARKRRVGLPGRSRDTTKQRPKREKASVP